MKNPSLLNYLALHRRGYLFAALWTALCSILFVTFVWRFRFDSFGLEDGDPAMDAFLQMPVSDVIQITRFNAMLVLAPLLAVITAVILMAADALLYLFRLDRDKIWFEAVKWSLRGWKPLLIWLFAFMAIFSIPISEVHPYVMWCFAVIALLLVVLLPFVVWNKNYLASATPRNFSMPQWPGSKPVLLTAIFLAISAPAVFFYNEILSFELDGLLVFFVDRLQDFFFALSGLLLASLWVNRERKLSFRKTISLKNVGGFFSTNMMLGLWGFFLLAPPIIGGMIISIFLMPSIRHSYKERVLDDPVLLQWFVGVADYVVAYWWVMLLPMAYWVLMHAYGRLIFLLDLIADKSDPQSSETADK